MPKARLVRGLREPSETTPPSRWTCERALRAREQTKRVQARQSEALTVDD